jgi:hypothetical protein
MGKAGKIPYLKDVILYFAKAGVIAVAGAVVLQYFGMFDLISLVIFSLFFAFPMKTIYLPVFLLTYLVFFFIGGFFNSGFVMLFVYMANMLANIFLVLVNIHYFVFKGKTNHSG